MKYVTCFYLIRIHSCSKISWESTIDNWSFKDIFGLHSDRSHQGKTEIVGRKLVLDLRLHSIWWTPNKVSFDASLKCEIVIFWHMSLGVLNPIFNCSNSTKTVLHFIRFSLLGAVQGLVLSHFGQKKPIQKWVVVSGSAHLVTFVRIVKIHKCIIGIERYKLIFKLAENTHGENSMFLTALWDKTPGKKRKIRIPSGIRVVNICTY